MTLQTLFFAIPNPPGGALADAVSTVGTGTVPLGAGIIVGTASDATASLELRVVVNNPGAAPAGQNINTELLAAQGNQWTMMQILLALDHLKHFIRQRGYIGGSGGPSGFPGVPPV